jgi:AbiV family abortive infection protein
VWAIDIPRKNVRDCGAQLIRVARNVADVRLSYGKYVLPLKDATEKDLDDFLSNPEGAPFISSRLMFPGIRLCLDNAISLTLTSDMLTSNQPTRAMFLTYTALEELGKAAILVDAWKKAPSGVAYIKVENFTSHTAKLLRAVEGLAGEVVLVAKHSPTTVGGALKALLEAAKSSAGNNGATAFRFLYRHLIPNLRFLRDMGEFFRESAIYVDYDGFNETWVKPWTRFSASEITDLNETIREYSDEYKSRLNPSDVSKIPKLEEILPTAWFTRLAQRWPPKK